MFAAERQRKITEIIKEYKFIDVSSLSSMLSVTEATVRKDLELLEQAGILHKMHGGAVLNEQGTGQPVPNASSFAFNIEDPYINEKRQLANIVIKLIKEGDIIYLGNGSTCAYIAEAICAYNDLRSFTVITNNLLAAHHLRNASNVTMICTGGQLLTKGASSDFHGQIAVRSIQNVFITKSFFSVDAISLNHGYMLASTEFHEVLSSVMQKSGECYVVADYSKFNKVSMLQLCGIEKINKLITNENIPSEYKTYLFENNKQLFTTIECPLTD